MDGFPLNSVPSAIDYMMPIGFISVIKEQPIMSPQLNV